MLFKFDNYTLADWNSLLNRLEQELEKEQEHDRDQETDHHRADSH